MTTHNFTDAMPVTGKIRTTDDGAVVTARVARAGNIQTYLGSEMGFVDRETIRVYRPEAEVFSADAINSYARKPITINHPAGGVTADSWRDLAVGEIDPVGIMRDGEFVTVPLIFRDAAAIALIQSADGPKELSMGYAAQIEMQDGVTPEGEAYDAVMSEFRMNHVAVVPLARGGNELRIGDGANAKWGASPYYRKDAIMANDANTRTVLIDGLSVVTTDAGAQALEKLQGQIADAAKAATAKDAAHAAEISAKDAELAKANAAKDAAEAKVLSDADIDKRVADRSDLVGAAKAIHADVKTDGLSDAAIRKAVVVAKLGDAMADKSEAYIDARFDILSEDAGKGDKIADAIKNAPAITDLNAAYAARNASLQDAWKSTAKKEA
jgi:hypothetical protein